jgi:hypothetical protein
MHDLDISEEIMQYYSMPNLSARKADEQGDPCLPRSVALNGIADSKSKARIS